jgi:hypothetical protein
MVGGGSLEASFVGDGTIVDEVDDELGVTGTGTCIIIGALISAGVIWLEEAANDAVEGNFVLFSG